MGEPPTDGGFIRRRIEEDSPNIRAACGVTANDQTIASLAILKVNFDQRGQDFIDNFVPFVTEALRQAGPTGTTAGMSQAVLRDDFGIAIPQGAVASVLRRTARQGLSTRSGNSRFTITRS